MEKFLRLFALLQPSERKSFIHFLRMDWKYPGRPLRPVQESIIVFLQSQLWEALNAANLKPLTKEMERAFWKERFPKKDFSIHTLTDLFSPCTRRLEIYLVLRHTNQLMHPLNFEANLRKEIQIRSGNPLGGKRIDQLTPLSAFKGFLTEAVLTGLFHEATALQNYDPAGKKSASLGRIKHVSDHLSALRSARVRAFIHTPGEEEVVAPQLAKENAILRGYLLLNGLLKEAKPERSWKKLCGIVLHPGFPMEDPECRELFALSIARGLNLFQNRHTQYLEGINELYKKGIPSGVILHKNKLTQQHFITAIKIAVLTGEIPEALQRLETYIPLLSEADIQLGVPEYCRSICLLEMGQASEARRQLESFKPRGIGKIQFYVQMAKIQFELSPEGLADLLSNFKRALLRIRNPKHEARVKQEQAYISLMRRLSEAELLSPVRAATLEKDILAFPYGQNWLMEKFREKRGGKKKRPH